MPVKEIDGESEELESEVAEESSPSGLTEKAVRGGSWVFALSASSNLFQFIKTIILARVLLPADFGLFGVALLALSVLDTFSQTGVRQALIQKKDRARDFLNTAWTIDVVRGIVIALLFFFAAPYIASFFKVTGATNILRAVGLSLVLTNLTNITVIYFDKELEFKKYFNYQFLGTIFDVLVSIVAVLILKNVWALVLGLLAGTIVRLIMSFVIDPYRPKLELKLEKAKELWKFGRWVLSYNALILLITQGDDIFVGKFLGAVSLGFYQMAYRISNMPATEVAHVIAQVTFPAYAKLQDDIPHLRKAYLRVLKATVILAFPVAGLIFVLAPDFTRLFLGAKWLAAVPLMQILVIFGVTRAVNATTGPIFQAVGKPKILAWVSLAQLIFMAAIIYPLARGYALPGIAWAVTLANLFCFTISFREVIKVTKETSGNIFKVIFPSLLSTAGIMFFAYATKKLTIHHLPLLAVFALSLLAGILVYFVYLKISGFSFKNILGKGLDQMLWKKKA